jgi:hypothetical protein
MIGMGGLNLISTGSCVRRNCRHTKHGKIFLHPRCHPEGGVLLTFPENDVLQLICGLCIQSFLVIAVDEPKAWQPRCHPDALVRLSYQHRSKVLRVDCARCHQKVTTILTRPIRET